MNPSAIAFVREFGEGDRMLKSIRAEGKDGRRFLRILDIPA